MAPLVKCLLGKYKIRVKSLALWCSPVSQSQEAACWPASLAMLIKLQDQRETLSQSGEPPGKTTCAQTYNTCVTHAHSDSHVLAREGNPRGLTQIHAEENSGGESLQKPAALFFQPSQRQQPSTANNLGIPPAASCPFLCRRHIKMASCHVSPLSGCVNHPEPGNGLAVGETKSSSRLRSSGGDFRYLLKAVDRWVPL